MTFDHESISLLNEAIKSLEAGFNHLPSISQSHDLERLRRVLMTTAERMRDNFPYQHPLYVGQMIKPPHAVARLAYMLALFVNPNNHALDGGRASSAMEKEAVAQIAKMFGWETHLGHLTGGGTMANFEALWIARSLAPQKAIVGSLQAHYTHQRLARVLGEHYIDCPIDARGRLNVAELERMLHEGKNIGTVVATLGTTAAGAVDPLPEILELSRQWKFRVHVDAAYGGYFTLASNLDADARAAFDCIGEADSIVVDPHKHGLQPYGCGCVLFRDPQIGKWYKHDSPYTYFTSDELHLGEISLECSRPGASAVALWTTIQLLPLVRGGEFAQSLDRCREAALQLRDAIAQDDRFALGVDPQLDIVTFAVRAPTATESSRRARAVFDAAAKHDLHLALATFPGIMLKHSSPVQEWDHWGITCLRACAMKPEHREWLPQIVERLTRAADEVL